MKKNSFSIPIIIKKMFFRRKKSNRKKIIIFLRVSDDRWGDTYSEKKIYIYTYIIFFRWKNLLPYDAYAKGRTKPIVPRV